MAIRGTEATHAADIRRALSRVRAALREADAVTTCKGEYAAILKARLAMGEALAATHSANESARPGAGRSHDFDVIGSDEWEALWNRGVAFRKRCKRTW